MTKSCLINLPLLVNEITIICCINFFYISCNRYRKISQQIDGDRFEKFAFFTDTSDYFVITIPA